MTLVQHVFVGTQALAVFVKVSDWVTLVEHVFVGTQALAVFV